MTEELDTLPSEYGQGLTPQARSALEELVAIAQAARGATTDPNLTDEEKRLAQESLDEVVMPSLEIRWSGIVEQAASDARDAKDGVNR